jgi:hypothetical protein
MVMVEKTDMTGEMDKINKTVQAERLKTLPASDGFHMPGEFEPHKGTIMIWPERPGLMEPEMPEKLLHRSQRP